MSGFTLLEVLVALGVLASALTLGYATLAQATTTTDSLHDRVYAHWAASNIRTEIDIGALKLARANTALTVTMMGREFNAEIERLQPAPGDEKKQQAPRFAINVTTLDKPTDILAHEVTQ